MKAVLIYGLVFAALPSTTKPDSTATIQPAEELTRINGIAIHSGIAIRELESRLGKPLYYWLTTENGEELSKKLESLVVDVTVVYRIKGEFQYFSIRAGKLVRWWAHADQ